MALIIEKTVLGECHPTALLLARFCLEQNISFEKAQKCLDHLKEKEIGLSVPILYEDGSESFSFEKNKKPIALKLNDGINEFWSFLENKETNISYHQADVLSSSMRHGGKKWEIPNFNECMVMLEHFSEIEKLKKHLNIKQIPASSSLKFWFLFDNKRYRMPLSSPGMLNRLDNTGKRTASLWPISRI